MDTRKLELVTGLYDEGRIMDETGKELGTVFDNDDEQMAEAFGEDLVNRYNDYPELIEAVSDLLRLCVTPKGMPDKGKGRTDEQQAAFDKARKFLRQQFYS